MIRQSRHPGRWTAGPRPGRARHTSTDQGRNHVMRNSSRSYRLPLCLAVAFSIIAASPARAAEPVKYPESPEGLEKLTNDMLAAVKDGNKERAAELAKSMVLPNH